MSIVRKFVAGLPADGGTSSLEALDTHNQMLGRSNAMWAMSGPRRRGELIVVGDSLAQAAGDPTDRSALGWAMMLFNLAVTIKPRGRRGVGTSTSGKAGGTGNPAYGMTSADRMAGDAQAITASIADRYAPIGVMFVQTNDSYAGDNGQGGTDSTVANVEFWFLSMLAIGLTHLVIVSGGPSATGGAASLRTRGISNAYRALADKYRGLITFVDNSEILAANTPAYTSLGGKGSVGSTLFDELHWSGYGAYLVGKYKLGPVLYALCGERDRLLGWIGDRYDQNYNSRGPLMGDQTRYGGSAVTIPAGTLSGTLAIEQADVADPIGEALGRPDIVARRLRFSGTPSAAGRLTIQRIANNPAGFNPMTIPFMPEANIWCDVTNMRAPNFGWTSGGVGGQNRRADENPDADIIPHLHGLLTMYAGDTILEGDNFGNRSTSLSFSWSAGREVAGDLILISASDYPQPPLPPASS